MITTRRTRSFTLIIMAGMLLIVTSTGLSQTLAADPQVDTGIHSYEAYDGTREHVNLLSGNLQFCIPLVSLPGRNGQNLNIPLCYNSHFVESAQLKTGTNVVSPLPWYSGSVLGPGWTLTGTPLEYTVSLGGTAGMYVALMPDGSKYPLDNYRDDLAAGLYNAYAAGVLELKDGTWISGYKVPDTFANFAGLTKTDTNGNKVTYGTNSVTDNIGRIVNVQQGNATSSNPAYIAFQYPDSNGKQQTVTVYLTSHIFSCSSLGTASDTSPYSVPSSILLPNGLSYTFQYDSCGLLNKISYPTGGYTRYDNQVLSLTGYWAGTSTVLGSAEITAKYVCHVPASAGVGNTCSAAEEETTYAPVVSMNYTNNEQNTVVDPLGNKTVYQFTTPLATGKFNVPPVEVSRQIYDNNNKLLRTIQTDYSVNSADYAPLLPTLPIRQTTTLDNGTVSKIEWDYALQDSYMGVSPLTEKREFDYGQGSPGLLLRKTDYTWLHLDKPCVYNVPFCNGQNVNTPGVQILDRKTSEIVHDGSGNIVAQTKYEYDNNTTTPSAAHGNLTAVKRWRNTDGAWLTTSNQYDSYGNVVSSTDPNGNTTTFSYADNYADGTNRNSNAFPTTITYPSVNGVAHVEKRQYYWGSGLIAASCGENSSGSCGVGGSSSPDSASYTYDLMGRKVSTSTGDGAQTTTTYNDASYPIQIANTKTIAAGVTENSTSILDGLGRVTQSVLNSDPSCSSGTRVDTTYDADGRVSTVSNPYCTTSDTTYGTTISTYDGLGRVTQVEHPDGSAATNTYTGRAVLSKDEGNGTNPVQRVSQTDALGRLAAVCEVSNTTQKGASGTAGSCGLDISETGFVTAYSYDLLGNLTLVSQGGVSRSFTYDSLSRLGHATNPESGATQYTYDLNGNLVSKTDARSVTTTYTYDGLNRLTGKSYSDGSTPSSCFQYDQGSTYGTGRLTTEWTQTGSCTSAPSSGVITKRSFSAYDLMGRVATDQQCAPPNNCNNSGTSYTLNYSYNLAGNLTQFANGLTGSSALTYAAQYDSADRLSWLCDQASGACPTGGLFMAKQYTPAGSLMSALMGSQLVLQRKYNNRLLPISETDTVPTTPGTANIQITGTEQTYAYSVGSFVVTGAEQSTTSNGTTTYDVGAINISEFGNPYASGSFYTTYRQGDTPATLATKIAASMPSCSTSGARVSAVASGSTVYLTSCTEGTPTQVNYPLQVSVGGVFKPNSFAVTASGSTMTPYMGSSSPGSTLGTIGISGTEQSANTGTSVIYDSGAYVIMFWAGQANSGAPLLTKTVSWGQGSTTASLLSALASSFGSCSVAGTLVSGTVNGSVVSFTSCQAGTTYSVIATLAGHNTYFAAPSFVVAAAATPIGGTPGVYDAGSVTLNINGTAIATTSYKPGSTPATIVSGLVSAGSNNGLVTLAPSTSDPTVLAITAKADGAVSDYSYTLDFTYDSTHFSAASFQASSPSGALIGGQDNTIYSWAVTSYAPNGNPLTATDSVMGTWNYTYDDMNRLTNGSAVAGYLVGMDLGWTYDRYGNRWDQNATGTGNGTSVFSHFSFTGNNNRIDGPGTNCTSSQAYCYDLAGNLLNDGIHRYTYDAENRIATVDGYKAYEYDAEGRRVAKYATSGSVSSSYVLGLGGEQVSELNSSGQWMHSNVYAGGKLLATYAGPGEGSTGYHFQLTDWLGTKRVQAYANGNREEYCYSYPFGDGLSCSGGTDATEHHFTGKERDTETGNDYFGARYYGSNLGRFLTPDWAASPTDVPYAKFGDPQSLNLYAYVLNNPNAGIDLDGHDLYGPSSWENANAQDAAFSEGQFNDYVSTTSTSVYQHSDSSWTLTPDPEAQQQDKQPTSSVTTNTYSATATGLRIILVGTVTGGSYTDFNWVQTVTTNDPLAGKPANQAYPDTDPGQKTPFYLNPKEQAQSEAMAKGVGASTVFSDQPSRNFSGTAINWHANLSLVGINKDGSFDRLKSFTYGFTLDAKGVHLDPLRPTQ